MELQPVPGIIPDVRYALHDDVDLLLDLYLPDASFGGSRPCVIMIHGGAMLSGSKASLSGWGHYFSRLGYVAASVDYRLIGDVAKAFPQNIYDIRSAIQFLRFTWAEHRIDPAKMALFGCSSGAYLAAMAILTAGDGAFSSPYVGDRQSQMTDSVDVAIVVSGTYDMIAAWQHDQIHRPVERPTESYLGGTPIAIRRTYFEASPHFYADAERVRGTKWLVSWGAQDEVVDSDRQSIPFMRALKSAGALVRICPVVAAGHYWLWHTDGDVLEAGSESAYLARHIRTFLRRWSGWDDTVEDAVTERGAITGKMGEKRPL